MSVSVAKKINASSHIAIELALANEDQLLIAEDLADEEAEKEYQKRITLLDMGQGFYPADIDLDLLKNGEDVELSFNVIDGSYAEWGVNVYDISQSVIQIDLKNMTHAPLSLLLERQMSDIDSIGEMTLLDVKSGKVFALQDTDGISVYVSKGAYVGDDKIHVVKISEDILGSKMDCIKQWFEEQNIALYEIYEPCPV